MLLPFLAAALVGVKAASAAPPARVSIVIDDLGNRLDWGARAVALPGPITVSFLPHTPYARRLAERAHHAGKEVMLHLPMQPVEPHRLGPGGLTTDMTRQQVRRTLQGDLTSVPYVRGVNNHMGSLLTADPGYMGWVMSALSHSGIYFVDSRTTAATVIPRIAAEYGIPAMSRDVFLDNRREPDLIRRQLNRLLHRAYRDGVALGIGHPYPETMSVLEQMLPRLQASSDIELVPVSKLFDNQPSRRPKLWHASLSPSQKAAKNSKQ